MTYIKSGCGGFFIGAGCGALMAWLQVHFLAVCVGDSTADLCSDINLGRYVVAVPMGAVLGLAVFPLLSWLRAVVQRT